MFRYVVAIVFIAFSALVTHAQQRNEPRAKKSGSIEFSAASTSSPAYAELLLKKTELQADLESILLDYTEEFPKVREIRHTLGLMQKETDRLHGIKAAEASKLTLALGKLIVRKIELETDMWRLLNNYKEEHPDVKRAKRKVEIYEAAIKEILG